MADAPRQPRKSAMRRQQTVDQAAHADYNPNVYLMNRANQTVAVVALVANAFACALGLFVLNSGLPLTSSSKISFDAVSIIASALCIAALLRLRPRAGWWIAGVALALFLASVSMMIAYQLGCAEQGACF